MFALIGVLLVAIEPDPGTRWFGAALGVVAGVVSARAVAALSVTISEKDVIVRVLTRTHVYAMADVAGVTAETMLVGVRYRRVLVIDTFKGRKPFPGLDESLRSVRGPVERIIANYEYYR